MSKKEIVTKNAPNAIGPYSQAVEINGFVYTSGQIAIDPNIGKFINGTINEQTHQVMKNLSEVLKASGLTFNDVVKTTIFCTNLTDFGIINEIYGSYLQKPFPARSTVQVAALPLSASVEIEMIAVKK